MQPQKQMPQAHHLPQQFTSFVGRDQELADITQRLTDPACRLLTLVGPGGIGKTRLAMQATAVLAPHFPDGTFFVNLQPVETEAFLISAIADALDITLTSTESPLAIIHAHLADKQILLTLDNFEQLQEAAPVLSELLRETAVKILVTSRETLNLQEEWLYPLGGMDFPDQNDKLDELSTFGAVQLFSDRAHRVRPDFSLADEIKHVTQICQLVEGMPLALELAAPWIKSLSCAEIAAEIQRSRDFLATRLRNMPERHRSLQAIFAQTWEGLSQQEKTVFQQLAVFRGGFLRDAAADVAQANLPLLTSLLDKSLLRWEAGEGRNGRYQIHELLHQYAAEKLEMQPEDAEQTLAKHAHYYTSFLDQRLRNVLGSKQIEAMADIEAELNNIRAAWQWAIDHQEAQMLLKMGMPLMSYYWFRSRFHEGQDMFALAIPCLDSLPANPERDLILAAMLTNLSWFNIVVEVGHDGVVYAERSFDLYQQLDKPPVMGLDSDPRLILALVYRFEDRIPETIDLLNESVIEAQSRPNPVNKQCAHRLLAQTYHFTGELEKAQFHAYEAIRLSDELEDVFGMAYNLDTVGRILISQGKYEEAAQELLAGYNLHKQIQFSQGLADICVQLTDLALRQGNAEEARKYASEGLTLYEENNTLNLSAAMIVRLAHAADLGGEQELTRTTILYCLEKGAGNYHLFSDTMCYMIAVAASLSLKRGDTVQSLRWASYALAQPKLQGIYREYAQDIYNQVSSKLEPGETAVPAPRSLTLKTVLTEIKSAFLSPFTDDKHDSSGISSQTAVTANQKLLDPLTNRELEVLQLIAEGLSNRQIAEELVISTGTVKYYTSHIYSKLQVTSRTQSVSTARELSILNK